MCLVLPQFLSDKSQSVNGMGPRKRKGSISVNRGAGNDADSPRAKVYLSLGCSVISVASIICVVIFFTYALLAGLRFTSRE
jgi:hypothetical protein